MTQPPAHSVITRFAPSPTGMLHLGSARTALFNYLFARHYKGQYRLRIEDTDHARSTKEAVQCLYDGLAWLGLEHDGEVVIQSSRQARHREVAEELVARGQAYYCYSDTATLEAFREQSRQDKVHRRFVSPWREEGVPIPANIPPVIRLKAPLEGVVRIEDRVQGPVEVAVSQLDDMVLLRADGTPTYMLAVVVDDHDMGVTHVIRGDDHLTNAFRQYLIYQAMGWDIPQFGHIPLIHGPDGSKLSKRHGATSVLEYESMGILPEALCNYLLRLGWGHGDDEIIPRAQAIEWFDGSNLGKAAARFDMDKLLSVNSHYMQQCDAGTLLGRMMPFLRSYYTGDLSEEAKTRLRRGIPVVQGRATSLTALAEEAMVFIRLYEGPISPSIRDSLGDIALLDAAMECLRAQSSWAHDLLFKAMKEEAGKKGVKVGELAQWLRMLLTGTLASPSIFAIMEVWGKEAILAHLEARRLVLESE